MKRNEKQADRRLMDRLDLLRTVPGRDPQAAAEGRANFLRQAEALGAPLPSRPEGRPAGRTGAFLPALRIKVGSPALKALLVIFLTLVVIFGGTASTVYAAQDSLPDEALYPVKVFSEDALLSLTASPGDQLKLTLDFTDRRVAEITELQSAGRPVPAGAVDRFRGELDQALVLAAGMADPAMTQSLDKVSRRTQGQLRAMDVLVNDNPGVPNLVGIQARLQEQAQAVELGKVDPQGFRLIVQEQLQNEGGKTSSDQNGPGKPKSTFETDRPGKTPEPGKHDRENNKPTETLKSPRHRGPDSAEETRTPHRDHHHRP